MRDGIFGAILALVILCIIWRENHHRVRAHAVEKRFAEVSEEFEEQHSKLSKRLAYIESMGVQQQPATVKPDTPMFPPPLMPGPPVPYYQGGPPPNEGFNPYGGNPGRGYYGSGADDYYRQGPSAPHPDNTRLAGYDYRTTTNQPLEQQLQIRQEQIIGRGKKKGKKSRQQGKYQPEEDANNDGEDEEDDEEEGGGGGGQGGGDQQQQQQQNIAQFQQFQQFQQQQQSRFQPMPEGSSVLANEHAAFDSEVVKQLKKEGKKGSGSKKKVAPMG